MFILPNIPIIGRYDGVSSFRMIGGGATPIDPATLSPVQWFDAQTASTILSTSGSAATNGSFVTVWNSRVGAFSASAVEAARPIYMSSGLNNKPALSFFQTTTMTHSYTRGTGKVLTLFAVLSNGSTTGYRGLYSTNDSGQTHGLMALVKVPTTGNFGTYGTQEWPSNVQLQGNPLCICVWQRTGDDGNMYFNGVSAGYFGNSVGQQGHLGGMAGQGMTGRIGELIMYDKVLTVDEITGVTAYLNSKWS